MKRFTFLPNSPERVNKRNIVIYTGLFLFLLIPLYSNTGDIEGVANYRAIREIHIKWEIGLWGSKSYYEKQLRKLLINMLDRGITTDFDYVPDLSRIIARKIFVSDTFSGGWLHIHGELEPESLKSILDQGHDYIREIERRKYLFAVSGKIRKFRIEDSQRGRILHIHLYSVKLIPYMNKK